VSAPITKFIGKLPLANLNGKVHSHNHTLIVH